jgi:hypothetical protein
VHYNSHTLLKGDRVAHKYVLAKQNVREAKSRWPDAIGRAQRTALNLLSEQYGFSVALGDLRLLQANWYVTHSGLLRPAARRRCRGISVRPAREFCDLSRNRWVFRATIYKSTTSRVFIGYGDADPLNTALLVRGAELRVAETRAVNRALRKAYGIGLCSVEELGSHPSSGEPPIGKSIIPANGNGSPNGQPRLRDKLCLLIRNHELDPTLVKRYANDFCGTETLREASRDLVKAFVATIAKEAANDRAALVCKLNSYSQPEEVRP